MNILEQEKTISIDEYKNPDISHPFHHRYTDPLQSLRESQISHKFQSYIY